MKQLFSVFAIFILLGLTGFNPLGSIRHLEVYEPGDIVEFHVNVDNSMSSYSSRYQQTQELEDAIVKAHFLATDDFGYSKGFEMDNGEKYGKWIFFQIPLNMQPGEYEIRIVLSNDKFHNVGYTSVTIV